MATMRIPDADRPDVFVSGDGFAMYDEYNGNARVAPDCCIAFGVDRAGVRENMANFWVWRVGKVPDFVMEMASPSTAANDLGPQARSVSALEDSRILAVRSYWRRAVRAADYGRASG